LTFFGKIKCLDTHTNSIDENKILKRNEKKTTSGDDANNQTENMGGNMEDIQSSRNFTNVNYLPLLESLMKTHR
jgi:hypothetical protein